MCEMDSVASRSESVRSLKFKPKRSSMTRFRSIHCQRTMPQACRTLGVSEQSYYRWRKEYGGLRTDQAKRLKDLEKENGRLRKAISDLTLDKLILKEALEGNC